MVDSFLRGVIDRNIRELKDAIMMNMVLDKLDETKTLHTLNFFMVTAIALYQNIITHLCRVYEINGKGKSFWFIENKLTKDIDKIAKKNSISIDNLKYISDRLKPIRDNTQFHIGSKSIETLNQIWEKSDIKNYEVRELLTSGYKILKDLLKDLYQVEYQLPDYDGSDIKSILESYIIAFPDNVKAN